MFIVTSNINLQSITTVFTLQKEEEISYKSHQEIARHPSLRTELGALVLVIDSNRILFVTMNL